MGYEVELYYVVLSSVELAKNRVEQRVKDGSMELQRRILKEDILNQKFFRKIASFVHGECKDCLEEIPKWCIMVLE